jgi:hypothetical protein
MIAMLARFAIAVAVGAGLYAGLWIVTHLGGDPSIWPG